MIDVGFREPAGFDPHVVAFICALRADMAGGRSMTGQ